MKTQKLTPYQSYKNEAKSKFNFNFNHLINSLNITDASCGYYKFDAHGDMVDGELVQAELHLSQIAIAISIYIYS